MNEKEIEAGLPKTSNYRYAEEVDGQLFVAGQVPHGQNGKLVGVGEPGSQATQCLRNLRTLLDVHGYEESHIRKLTVYVVGQQESAGEAWKAVAEWFDNDVPPATLLGIAGLGYRDQVVEIDATVMK